MGEVGLVVVLAVVVFVVVAIEVVVVGDCGGSATETASSIRVDSCDHMRAVDTSEDALHSSSHAYLLRQAGR